MIGTLIGGLNAVREMRRLGRSIDEEMRAELARKNRITGEDPTGRADALHFLGELDRSLRAASRQADASVLTAGIPGETAARARNSAASTLASATSRIAAEGASRRERAEADYASRRSRLNQLRRSLLGDRALQSVKAGGFTLF